MGIFVTDKDNFTVTCFYEEAGDEIKILSEDSKDKATTQVLSVTCKRPDFGLSQNLLRASTVQGQVDVISFKNNLLYMLATTWTAKDADGKAMECNINTLSGLRVEVAVNLSEKIEAHLGGVSKILPVF